jgi:methionyl-tRNA formyltransferase
MKLCYFGLPLGALLLARDGHELAPVVLSPVPAPGRWRARRRFGKELLEPESLDARELLLIESALGSAEPELLVSWFWTRKLPVDWLRLPRLGGIGVHPSLLPRHRGPDPYFWAIDCGDADTGVTLHQLAEEYDTGAVLASERLPIGSRNAWQLARALDRPSLRLLRWGVSKLACGEALEPAPQDERLASAAPAPTGDLLRVDFGWATDRVLRRIRALAPVPGLALEVLGTKMFVSGAERTDTYVQALLPGEAEVGEELRLRTGDGAIRVLRAFFPSSSADGFDDDGARRGQVSPSEDEGEELSGADIARRIKLRSLMP